MVINPLHGAPMDQTEAAISNDILSYLTANATGQFFGRGSVSSVGQSQRSSYEIVLTYADGVPFAVYVDVQQLNITTGQV